MPRPRTGAEVAGQPSEAASRIAFVLNLRHRHPHLWARVIAGHVAPWQARIVTDRARDLSREDCAVIDEPAAAALIGLSWGRAQREVDRLILLADPHLAMRKIEDAAAFREVRVSRIDRGHVDVWARLGAADGVALDTALDRIADALPAGDRSTVGQRRARGLGLLARNALGVAALPEQLPLGPPETFDHLRAEVTDHLPDSSRGVRRPRSVELVVHLAGRADPYSGEVNLASTAELDRYGHVLTNQLAELLRGCRVKVQPILDVARAEPQDGYRVPTWMGRVLEAQMPYDMFPYATTPARRCQWDHTVAYDHERQRGAGQTRLGNLAPLGQRSHRVKTHGGWLVEQPEQGVLHWVSPLGYRYTVTGNGTTAHPQHVTADSPATQL
nr:DUF222 domain-containing protein [Granulicoccus phenolivorans]